MTFISTAVGVLGGFVGLALGTMRLPALLLMGMAAPTAAGTNIFVSGLSSMTGAMRHWREGRVSEQIVLVMGIPAFIGAFIGGFGSDRVPEGVLLFMAGLLVFWQGVELLARSRSGSAPRPGPTGIQANKSGLFTRNRTILEAGVGLSVGLLGGAVGLILGSIRLPALKRILRVDPRIAAGTNLFIGFIMGSVGWIGHVIQGQVNYSLLGMMGAGAMVGSYYGAKLTGKVSLDTLIKTMGGVLLVVGPLLLWQDNNDNHKGAINENYGRELLELFSMGIGNYTEEDVKEGSRAFTGWTVGNAEYMAVRARKDSIWPYSRIAWHFQYREQDHDDGEKTFLGEIGNFNGEDIIDIIVKQEATARFISTRLFQFFAADEVSEDGEKVIAEMMGSYFDSSYEIRAVLRTLFNSSYFKSERARYARVKGPVELIVGAMRLAGSYKSPTLGIEKVTNQSSFMGQRLLQPPSVEGWHEGSEWIDSGSLVERVNFVAQELGNTARPGVRAIIDRLCADNGRSLTPEELVDRCLDLVGPITASEATRATLVGFAKRQGNLDLKGHQPGDEAEQRVGNILRLVASSREFQLA